LYEETELDQQLFMPSPVISDWSRCLSGLFVGVSKIICWSLFPRLRTRYPTNCLWEFCQIYNYSAVV